MQLFRSVFIVAAAALAFVATEAPQASAFILPMTRYMLDAVPDAAEGTEGSTGAPAGAPLAEAPDNVPTDPNIPVAIDTPAVAGSQEPAADISPLSEDAQGSSTSEAPVSEPSSVDVSAVSSAVVSVIPSPLPQDNILAQTNAAGPAVGFGSPTTILIGSVLVTIFFSL
ncbi:hypothetical protein BV20DRAFT_464207 [Pilatotrama ljubarskyi]|nr:hypothetical protein BV20DRAFT_464207 [Pilatotrama ljubarskyi]